jgi:hypothetical protein
MERSKMQGHAKIIKLREKSKSIQLIPKEALQEALNSQFDADSILVIMFQRKTGPSYEFWQGGGITVEEMLWHIEQFKNMLLEGRLDRY